MLLRYTPTPAGPAIFHRSIMAHQDTRSPAAARSRNRNFGLAQMSAAARLAIVVPIIAAIWLILWLLVRS